ncbi:MAG: ABC transporter permease [Euzebyales bacterium]|jgi:ABC-type polysaccharide/polyol phosphate export permease|nr:ABC transporter permease [Euzebyales bacterium]
MAVAPASRLGDVRQARELLRNLVGKELKVRYKQSALGFVWSLVTPLLMTAIFTVVFATFLRIPVEDFASFFLAGYLVWQFYANSVNASVGAIVSNGSLIRKVYFPREVIPLSLVLAQAFHLCLALLATAPFFLLQRGNFLPYLPAILIGIVLLVAFTAGMSMVFAALNVSFRDLQELTQVIFLAWFYGTPVIYPLYLVESTAQAWVKGLILANPMTWFVQLFQTALYGIPAPIPEPGQPGAPPPGWPSLTTFAVCAAWAVGTLGLGWWLFRRRAVTFAKEV